MKCGKRYIRTYDDWVGQRAATEKEIQLTLKLLDRVMDEVKTGTFIVSIPNRMGRLRRWAWALCRSPLLPLTPLRRVWQC